jgi:RimJ/RimL family protein N-acetyltransferase
LRHDLSLDGYGFRLRPVCDEDVPFILSLRTDPTLSRYIHHTSQDPSAQLLWLKDYYQRPGDFYFIIETRDNGRPEGTVGLYRFEESARSAEWGRWLLKSGSLAGVESVWLIYRMAFDELGLSSVRSRTLIANEKVLSLHDACGCRRRGTVRIGEETFVEHELCRAGWASLRPDLETKAERIAARLRG